MNARCIQFAACYVLIVLAFGGAGCISAAIGDVTYRNDTLVVPVSSSMEGSDAFVQVTIYEIKESSQQKLTTHETQVFLKHGLNEISIKAHLPPGTYKLYVYIFRNGERLPAAIRDIIV